MIIHTVTWVKRVGFSEWGSGTASDSYKEVLTLGPYTVYLERVLQK